MEQVKNEIKNEVKKSGYYQSQFTWVIDKWVCHMQYMSEVPIFPDCWYFPAGYILDSDTIVVYSDPIKPPKS
jgi:hypothetical protein